MMQGEMAAGCNAEVGVGCGSSTSRAAVGRGIRWARLLDRPGGVRAELVLVPVAEGRILEGVCSSGLPLLATARSCSPSPASICAGSHMVAATLASLWTGWHRRPILLGASPAACLFRNNGRNSRNLCY